MKDAGEIKNWSDLMTWLEQSKEEGWLFRGQVREHKHLVPKIGRFSADAKAQGRGYTPEREERVLREFRKAARPYSAYQPRTQMEWLALGQHHGLPTRLLDWSSSLLVATFFAIEKAGKVEGAPVDAVVYSVRDIPELPEGSEKSALKLTKVYHYFPPHISPRIPAQRSVLTIHPRPDQPFDHSSLEKRTIPSRACWQLKRALNAAGFNYAAMAPDIDGVCKQIDWMYKWSFFEGRYPPASRLS